MTLDRKHLMMMLPLFAAAMAYNLWYFTRAESTLSQLNSQAQAEAPGQAGPVQGGPSVAGAEPAVDPMQIPPAPDVELDRPPAWNRNPFIDLTAPPPAAQPPAATSGAAPPDAPPDIVVSAIVIGDRPRARVNGRNMYVGDRVGAATIVEILPRAIVVESAREGRRTIPQQRRTAAPAEAARP